jgi:hypothetical protein
MGWIKAAWNIVYKAWDTLTDMLVYGLTWWWNTVKAAWNFVIGLYNDLTDALIHGILWWKDKIVAGWNMIMKGWNDLVDYLVYAVTWWTDTIKAGWNMIVKGWNDLVDYLVYAITWWKDLIDEGWKKVTDTWNYVIDALAKGLEPIADPINSFFDKVKQVWDYLMGKVDSILGWLGFANKKPEMAIQTVKSETESEVPNSTLAQRREDRAKADLKDAIIMDNIRKGYGLTPQYVQQVTNRGPNGSYSRSTTYGNGEYKDELTQGGKTYITVNNSPTTNVGGGGGAMPVVISPTPVRNMDPTRGLINN